jgi:hypothetical protein
MVSAQLRRILPLALAAGLLSLPACGGGGSSTVGGGGGIKPPPPPASYSIDDLMGDWVGQLQPAAIGSTAHNVYLRFANGVLTEAAESDGGQWTEATASMGFVFSAKGVLKTDLRADLGSSRLLVSGQMDAALATITGTFTLRSSGGQKLTGSFTLSRSSGADQYSQEMLTGRWDGLGQGSAGKFRFLKFELDTDGIVVDGLLKHPDTQEIIRNYANGAATFTFFDSSIGRIENVVMTSMGGHTLTFEFLLLDVDGELLAGPGVESGLGAGIGELVRGI